MRSVNLEHVDPFKHYPQGEHRRLLENLDVQYPRTTILRNSSTENASTTPLSVMAQSGAKRVDEILP